MLRWLRSDSSLDSFIIRCPSCLKQLQKCFEMGGVEARLDDGAGDLAPPDGKLHHLTADQTPHDGIQPYRQLMVDKTLC